MIYINSANTVNAVWLPRKYGYGETEAKLGTLSANIAQNGDYTYLASNEGLDGYKKVNLHVNVECGSGSSYDSGYTDGWADGYDSGYTDGGAAQKALLESLSITENGEYTRENGWSAITVNVPTGQTINNQTISLLLFSGDFQYENGRYDCWRTIRPDSGYTGIEKVSLYAGVDATDAINEGKNQQKALLTSTSFTENGEYTRENGWSAVTVNVPVTAYTDQDLIANLQGDYFVIPSGTTHLADYALAYRCFSSITIPNSVTALGEYAFAYNECLTDITIPNSVTSIGEAVFEGCYNLTSATIPDTVTEWTKNMFYNCRSLSSITIPDTVTKFSTNSFYLCIALSEVAIPPLVDYLPVNCFGNCYSLSSITIPDSVTGIGNGCFYRCSGLTEITIPDSITVLGQDTFNSCFSLTGVTLPKHLTSMGYACFSRCGALEEITIPQSVTGIERDAFFGCSGLTAMTFEGLVPPTLSGASNSLGQTTYTFPIYVPCAVVEDYKTAWPSYANRITCNSGQTMPTALTLNVDSAITDSGQATVTIEPNDGEGNISFSSSDNTIATIDQNGDITVLSTGTVTICAYDSRSGLQDCETISVIKSSGTPSGDTALEFTYITTENNQAIHLINGDAEGSSQAMYNFYSAITSMEIDGVTVQKDPDNIKCYTVPAGLCWYEYTFANAGLHTVKFYVSSAFTNLGTLLFSLQGDTGKIVSANIGAGITDLTHGVFQSQETLSAVTLPDTLLRITSYPFEYTGIKSITIPDSVTAITSEAYLRGAFNTCSAMTDITIGSGITRISGNTFRNCSALKTVTVKATTPPALGNDEFSGVQLNHIYVPAESVELYKAATNWSRYSNIISAIQ